MGPPAKPIIVIPTRLASTRLPGKVLADIHGTPMLVHVWRRAVAAGLGPVLVACAERQIADVITQAGGEAVMTRSDHATGSDRVFEAVRAHDPGGAFDAVINLQGDLPTVEPGLLAAVLEPLADPGVDIATLAVPITEVRERDDPNVVKAVAAVAPGSDRGRALYFSRAPVPAGEGPLLHHIGIYAYRPAALARFVALPAGVLEQREKLEQLRALEAGMHVSVALVDSVPDGVDTPADLERARARLAPK